MKKSVGISFLLGILLISPLIFAQEQSQTYSGFNRFVDNFRLFFSLGDNQVQLALEIREKELNSALENIKENNEGEANKNLENALDKLVIVQEKVSSNVADEVTDSVNKVVEKINESNLTETLDRYVLEEKKTQLVAELVVEVEGKIGQTLMREVVKNGTDGRKIVKIVVRGENNETEILEVEGNGTATWEIVGQINNVDNQIGEWIVEHTYAEGTSADGGESGVVVEGSGKNVQMYVAEGGHENEEPLPEPDLNEKHYDSSQDKIITNEIVEGDGGEGDYAEGTTAGGSDGYAEGTTAEGTNILAE